MPGCSRNLRARCSRRRREEVWYRPRAAADDLHGARLSAKKDGGIHTDSKTKIITVLLYLNEHWSEEGGRLRLLRNGTDLESYAAEVPPTDGTLLRFLRSNNSWHGHKPYEGPRRAVQFNWVTSEDVVKKEQGRHRLSTRVKWLKHLVVGHGPVSAHGKTNAR